MATAKDFPVTFGYLEKWGTYTHRGEDRAMDTGTPVIVSGTQIGLSGNTGKSTGPHLHLQCGRDKYAQTTIKPSNYWFKGDTVVETGTASEWGNYVIVKYSDVYCVYAHLSKITVKAGQKLGGTMLSTSFIKDMYHAIAARTPSAGEITFHSTKSTAHGLLRGFIDNGDLAWKKKDVIIANQNKALAEKDAIIDKIKKEALAAQGELKENLETANAKIILLTDQNEDLKEDLEEANQVDEKQVVENWFKKLWNKLFN